MVKHFLVRKSQIGETRPFGEILVNQNVTENDFNWGVVKKKSPLLLYLRGSRAVPGGTDVMSSSPYEIRTRITTVKGWCPNP